MKRLLVKGIIAFGLIASTASLASASLLTNLIDSYALTANSNDAVGTVNGTDTSVSYSTTGGNLSATYNGSTSKTVMSAPTITGSGDFTIECYIYPTSVTLISQYFVSNRKASDDNLGIYAFHIDNSNSKLNFWDFGGGSFHFPTTSFSTGTITANAWTAVGFTRSGTTGTYYINGSPSGTTASAGGAVSYSSAAGHPMTLGFQAADVYFFAGSMTSCQVYTRALSDAEMSSLYNSGTVLQYPFGISSTPPTLGFFRFFGF